MIVRPRRLKGSIRQRLAQLSQRLSRGLVSSGVDYLKAVQEIAAETQKAVTRLMTSCVSPHDDGSNPSAGWLQGFEQCKGFAQQITDMTAANTKVASDATARMASSAASLSKKGA